MSFGSSVKKTRFFSREGKFVWKKSWQYTPLQCSRDFQANSFENNRGARRGGWLCPLWVPLREEVSREARQRLRGFT